MTEHELVSWLIPGLASILCFIMTGILKQLTKLNTNVQKLSVSIAVVAERVNHHEKRIQRLETPPHDFHHAAKSKNTLPAV